MPYLHGDCLRFLGSSLRYGQPSDRSRGALAVLLSLCCGPPEPLLRASPGLWLFGEASGQHVPSPSTQGQAQQGLPGPRPVRGLAQSSLATSCPPAGPGPRGPAQLCPLRAFHPLTAENRAPGLVTAQSQELGCTVRFRWLPSVFYLHSY